MSKLDEILNPIFKEWLADEQGLIGEMSTNIRADYEEARKRNAERLATEKKRLKELIIELSEQAHDKTGEHQCDANISSVENSFADLVNKL